MRPISLDYNFLFWNYSPILLFLIRSHLGRFWTFSDIFAPFWAIVGVGLRSKKCLEVCGFYISVILFWVGGRMVAGWQVKPSQPPNKTGVWARADLGNYILCCVVTDT